MNDTVDVSKQDGFMPVPSAWRKTIAGIVDAFRGNDFTLARLAPGVLPVSPADARHIADYIADYVADDGDALASLPEDTWDTSVCEWIDGFWDVMVDLYTVDEGHSDMVLALRVREETGGYVFEVRSVYVP